MGGGTLGKSNKVCPHCGRKLKQQFVGLQHCGCGVSWKKDIGYFERTEDMIFALDRRIVGGKAKQVPIIRYRGEK
jgi:predicted amidophosphoribosyltransferase